MRLAYQLPNEPVHFIIASAEFLGTAEELWAFNVERDSSLVGVSYIEIEETDFPLINMEQQNSFRQKPYRNAWKIERDKIVADLSSAKEIHLRNLRRIREDKLKALDTEFMIAQREGKDLTELNAKRRELLDATDPVKTANFGSQEELYSAWPTVLERRNA